MKGGPSTNARIRDAFTVPQGTDRVELDVVAI